MTIQNLKQGQVIKNYKELCKILDIKVKAGDSKKAQLKELARYCKFTREGFKYIIEEIYNKPLEKVDNRGKSENSRNHNIYAKYLDILLIDYFSTLDVNKKYFYTTYSLAESVKLINHNYQTAINNKNKFFWWFYDENTEENLNKQIIFDFFNRTKSTIKNIIRESLKRFEADNLINFKEGYIIYYSNVLRIVTEEEKEIIIKIENELLKELDIKSKFQLQFNDSLRMKYYKKLKERVKKEFKNKFCINITNLYQGYEVIVKSKNIEKLKQEDRKDYQLKLNQTFERKVIETLENQYNKTIAKYSFKSRPKLNIESFNLDRICKNYTENGKKIFKILCGNYRNIITQILEKSYDSKDYKDIRKAQYNKVVLGIAKEACYNSLDKETAKIIYETCYK